MVWLNCGRTIEWGGELLGFGIRCPTPNVLDLLP
jgi:hypothetical protein